MCVRCAPRSVQSSVHRLPDGWIPAWLNAPSGKCRFSHGQRAFGFLTLGVSSWDSSADNAREHWDWMTVCREKDD